MASSTSHPRFFALIIGIDDYTPETGFCKLKGAVHDANSIHNWLVKDFNVLPDHIQDLRDETATKEAINQALNDLSNNSQIIRGDPILIYYAGHGTEAPAPPSWRWDAPTIQMIVPWDFKKDADRITQGIPDRTLGALLTKLAEEKGDNITVIFDCCHSGSGTRSGSDTRVRGGSCAGQIPDDLDDDIVLPLSRTRGAGTPAKFRHYGLRSHVLLAACAPHEPALENKTTGAFTGALLKALHGVDTAELTYEGLLKRMDKLTTQSPQCEGYNKGRLLFDRKVANIKPVLDVTRDKDELTIAGAGAIHGIKVGSKFAIWRSRKDLDTEPLATVTVDVVSGKESRATFRIASSSPSFVAQIKENPKSELLIYVPHIIRGMDCFENLILETEGRPPLSIDVVEDKERASIGLTYLKELNEIGFEMLKPEEQDQKIRHTVAAKAEDLHEALDHLCHYYYHRDRVNANPPVIGEGEDQAPFSSKFTVDVFHLKEKAEGIYEPLGPNRNIQGTGVQLTVGAHSKEECCGFRITNNTNLHVFPYLFYFDSSDFSIRSVYKPVAVAQTGAQESSIAPLLPNGTLSIGYGSEDAPPVIFTVSDEHLDLEQGYLRLYVSTQHVDLSTLEKGPISTQRRGMRQVVPRKPLIWDAITVPVVIKRGEEPPSIPMVGIVGSRSNGKSTFLKELAKSLANNTSARLEPSSENAFISEYNITLAGPNGGSLTIVDLPAFEDNNIDHHVSVLKPMVTYLKEQYQKGRQLTSLIWCYNISKTKFTAVDWENLNLVKDLSGTDALKNVRVLTTNWNKGAGVGANAAKPGALATVVSPLVRYKKAEFDLKSLCKEAKFERFGTFSDPAARTTMLGSTPAGDFFLELIRSLLSNEELQVQREACETRILAGTTAGKRLQGRLEEEIQKKEGKVGRLVDDLGRKVEAEQDISRWKATLEEIKKVNSA